MLSEFQEKINSIKKKISDIKTHINIDGLKTKQRQLEEESSSAGFWNDSNKAQSILQELKSINSRVQSFLSIEKETDTYKSLFDFFPNEELFVKETNEQDISRIQKDIESLERSIKKLEFSTFLNGPHDTSDAIVSINAGAGGTDAQDWAEILLRMFSRWSEDRGFETELADISYGEQAGIKSAVLFIRGPYAYGYLRSETGIHRLVRMSPFNSDGKRHTSFAAVEVIPEIGEELAVEIKPEDLKTDTYRASGPGGQNVNKTSSAVRITHIPTGIIAQSQASPSQHRNREICMLLLVSRLKGRLEQEKKEKIEELRGEQKQIGWGSQIRSYVFAPYQLVKDHRTGAETGNVQSVIDGDIDIFIEAFLRKGKSLRGA
ncbi:MAG: peptide chain release factor 2 [Candidatus Margulisiibacteriota bacterium]